MTEQKAYVSGMTFKNEASKRKLLKILEHFKDVHFVVDDLQNVLHVARNSCTMYVNHLHFQTRQIYVVDWRYCGEVKKHPTAVYAVGNGVDMPKPARKKSTQKVREWRAKKKLQLPKHERFDKRKTANFRSPRPDVAASWINRKD